MDSPTRPLLSRPPRRIIDSVGLWRTIAILSLMAIPSPGAPFERVLTVSDGNFALTGQLRLARGQTATLRFRSKAGLGYRLQFGGPASGRLDDPGRRPGVLAAPAVGLDVTAGGEFRLTAEGSRFQLAWNGKPVWDYTEREAGVASSGAVILKAANAEAIESLDFQPRPATPPSFAERYGPGLGEPAPPIRAVDQYGKPRDFASLRGPKGLWILFFRSADW
jgi:hypothetical protein